MTTHPDPEGGIPVRRCRLCGEPFTLRHAAWTHPVEWQNYLASRIDFGMSIFEVMEGRRVEKTAIRS